VQPVALRYSDATHDHSPAVEFLGQTTLLQSMWRVAQARGLRVRVELLPVVASAHADRRALAAQLRQLIAQALRA
jgi:1-acyl-sn-glycerol-3-phosphate acyltransferase